MNTRNKIASVFLVLCLVIGYSIESKACTRVVYKGPNSTILTGRTMDFSIEIPANQ